MTRFQPAGPTRKEMKEQEFKSLLNKDYVKNNPTFTNDHILEFHTLFLLYQDPYTKKIDMRDIISTAKTLGLEIRFKMMYKVLLDLLDQYHDTNIDFEHFINDLTEKMGSAFNENGRRKLWELIDVEGKEDLDAEDLKIISKELRYNLSDAEITEVIQNVGGFDSETVSYDKFEKYMARKINRNQMKSDLK